MRHIKIFEEFASDSILAGVVEFHRSGNSRFWEGDIEGVKHEIRPANHLVGDTIEIYEVPKWDFSQKGKISSPIGMGKIIDISGDRNIFVVELR